MSFIFGLIMFICIVPAMLIIFAQIYPKNWREKKIVLGVKNRDEFREDPIASEINAIVIKRHKQAALIVAFCCIVSALLLLLRGMIMQTTIWTAFIFIAILLLELPYVLGNREMKEIKRKLGLNTEAGISYVDLKNAGAVHALNPLRIWLPTLLGLIPVIFALLIDCRVILPGKITDAGSFLITSTLGMFWLISLTLLILARVIDNAKNEVISDDSDINANYNRAKKKNFADLSVMFSWINLGLMICWLVGFIFLFANATILIAFAVYMALMFIGIAVFVRRSKMIDAHYSKEMTLLADDDDSWILGLIYYNPADHRLNIEKRAGVGVTVNAAHPVGKVIYGLSCVVIVGVVLMLVWLGMTENTPMTVRYENGSVICSQLSDEYVIDINDIKIVSYGTNLSDLSLNRTFGFGTINIQKGTFTVDGQSGCTVFLWMPADNYIRIVTDKETYYINGASPEETRKVYESIAK
ncbi:MAG: hypothetical protein J6Y89_08305 [Lachnospiraceae bacterium]|nr:hypothetical protein [Lachnospiraceae bacterium]